jgi:phosphonate transport system substrate-binding protein
MRFMPAFCLVGLWLCAGLAQAAATVTPLVFGVFPYVTSGQLMAYHHPLKVYLESRLKRPVELVTAPDFGEFVARTERGDYDLILTAPHMARLAEKRDGYRRIARTGNEVQGVFLVRRDSGIRSLADLKGRKIMAAQPLSIVYQMAMDTLKTHGLVPGQDLTVVQGGTHNNALYASMRQETEASVTGAILWSNADESLRATLVEIGRTQSVPGLAIMAHLRLSPALRQEVQALLLDFEHTPAGKVYFDATNLGGLETIDDRTMRALDPYTRILTTQAR